MQEINEKLFPISIDDCIDISFEEAEKEFDTVIFKFLI